MIYNIILEKPRLSVLGLNTCWFSVKSIVFIEDRASGLPIAYRSFVPFLKSGNGKAKFLEVPVCFVHTHTA